MCARRWTRVARFSEVYTFQLGFRKGSPNPLPLWRVGSFCVAGGRRRWRVGTRAAAACRRAAARLAPVDSRITRGGDRLSLARVRARALGGGALKLRVVVDVLVCLRRARVALGTGAWRLGWDRGMWAAAHTMSIISPSSGFGCDMSSWIETSTVEMLSDGFHAPFGGMLSVSRQMRPAESMFGW